MDQIYPKTKDFQGIMRFLTIVTMEMCQYLFVESRMTATINELLIAHAWAFHYK